MSWGCGGPLASHSYANHVRPRNVKWADWGWVLSSWITHVEGPRADDGCIGRVSLRGARTSWWINCQLFVVGCRSWPGPGRTWHLGEWLPGLEAHAPTWKGELVAFIETVCVLKEYLVAGKTRTNMVEIWARETSDIISKLWSVVEGLNRTGGGQHMPVVSHVGLELSHVGLVIISAQPRVSTWLVRRHSAGWNGFHVQGPCVAPCPFVRGLSGIPQELPVTQLVF